MRNGYPNFRRAQHEGGPSHRPPPRRETRAGFIAGALVIWAAAAIGVWNLTPIVIALGRQATLAPADLRRIERSVYYSGCNEARAAGAAPIYRGQPGYREEMDGDGDGIACEPIRR